VGIGAATPVGFFLSKGGRAFICTETLQFPPNGPRANENMQPPWSIMAQHKYLLNAEAVRRRRKTLGETQKELAKRAQISPRWLIGVEKGKRPVKISLASLLAEALDVELDSLLLKSIRESALSWKEVPGLSQAECRRLQSALELDMAGNPLAAVEQCDRILSRLRPGEGDFQTVVTIKKATFLDNAGKHREALAILDSLLENMGSGGGQRKEQWCWAKYHRAIANRRLGQFKEAERELRELQQDGDGRCKVSAQHQLGTVYLELAAAGREKFYRRALACFEAVQEQWGEEGDHREGFAYRRMAEVYAAQGQLREALKALFSAATVFAAHECRRYVRDVEEEFQALLAGCGPLAAAPKRPRRTNGSR
jgi:transcriptional regulator with XRE-family HTH domain